MWVIAHRGGGELFPENTMRAFQESESLGVDMVECDVHVSRDGEIMVIHDPTLSRTGGTPLFVKDLTADELASIDVGEGQGVPTLASLLDAVKIPLVVEIKAVEVVQALVRLLQGRPELSKRIVPISFYHAAVKLLADRFPDLEAGVLLAGVPIRLHAIARDAHVRHLSLAYEMVDKGLVDAMHRENLLVSVWTPNTPKDIAAMVAAGVDGIASDRPDLVLQAVADHA